MTRNEMARAVAWSRHAAALMKRVDLAHTAAFSYTENLEDRMSKERIGDYTVRVAELFSLGAHSPTLQPVVRLEIPSHFEHPPGVVLYGAAAFQLVLRHPAHIFCYMEIESWRAPDPKLRSSNPASESEEKSGADA